MTRATWMKFVAGVLLFGTWLGLVLAHLTPAPALVDAIGYALVGLGIYHAASDDGNMELKFFAGLLLWISENDIPPRRNYDVNAHPTARASVIFPLALSKIRHTPSLFCFSLCS